MCTVSVIMDYGRHRIPDNQWTRPVWNEYQEILRRLADLDTKLGQPHRRDEEKGEWMKRIEERLAALEKSPTGISNV